jgi:hypothetical protein
MYKAAQCDTKKKEPFQVLNPITCQKPFGSTNKLVKKERYLPKSLVMGTKV